MHGFVLFPRIDWAGVLPESCKEFRPTGFHSAREDEHGRFRALFAGMLCLKMQNGPICAEAHSNQYSAIGQKEAPSNQQLALSQSKNQEQRQNHFTWAQRKTF